MYKRKLNGKWAGMRRLKEEDIYAAANLLKYLKDLFPISDTFIEEIKPMLEAFIAIRLVQFAEPGKELKIALWIDMGYVRLYKKFINKAGKEVQETIDFAGPQSILVISECFFNDEKCSYHIEIAKGTVVIPFTRELFDTLKLLAPETSELANSVLSSKNPAQMEKLSFVRLSGKDRYDLFMEIYGEEINQFFKQNQIASLLGISAGYLSKLRAKRNKKKDAQLKRKIV